MGLESAALVTAGLFALVNGVNDGGTLLSLNLRSAAVRVSTALALLALAVGAAPPLLGASVAGTLSTGLIAPVDGSAALGLTVVGVTLAVVLALNRAGLPTSLTLALIGALVGAGMGAGIEVATGTASRVLVAAAAAPLLGAVVATVLTALAGWVSPRRAVRRRLVAGNRVAFGLQAVAYGANDGQKMLAMVLLMGLVAPGAAADVAIAAAAVAMLFLAGSAYGVRRFRRTVGALVPMSPVATVAAGSASALVVLGSAGLGMPVSMTQTTAGGLVGTALPDTHRRVRWELAAQIALAWLVTLPASLVLAALVARLLR